MPGRVQIDFQRPRCTYVRAQLGYRQQQLLFIDVLVGTWIQCILLLRRRGCPVLDDGTLLGSPPGSGERKRGGKKRGDRVR
jgi:hypothetical protein